MYCPGVHPPKEAVVSRMTEYEDMVSAAAEASERYGDDECERFAQELEHRRRNSIAEPTPFGLAPVDHADEDNLYSARAIYLWVAIAVVGWTVVVWLLTG